MLAPEGFGTVVIGAVLLFATPDHGRHDDAPSPVPSETPAAQAARAPEGDWISLSGEVRSVSPQRFLLDYGGEQIIVDMGGGPQRGAHLLLRPGDRVTVSGVLNSGFYSRHRLHADTVYSTRLDSLIFTDPEDAEDLIPALLDSGIGTENGVAVTGTVAGIQDRRLTLSTGGGTFTIDTSGMTDDPTRRPGAARVDVGDRISAAGRSGTAGEAGSPALSASRITVLPAAGPASRPGRRSKR